MNEQDADMLERMVDFYGLASVLAHLATLCSDKAEHIESNWQCPTLARQWEQMSGRVWTAQRAARYKGLT